MIRVDYPNLQRWMQGVSDTIEDMMTVRGLTEGDLCQAIGINTNQLDRRWKTEVYWTVKELFAIAGLFGVRVWALCPDLPIPLYTVADDDLMEGMEAA